MEVTGIITAIIVGLIIGALGRLVVPGKQNMDRTDYPGRAGRRRGRPGRGYPRPPHLLAAVAIETPDPAAMGSGMSDALGSADRAPDANLGEAVR